MKKIIVRPEALLQEVFGEKARIVARESGFVRRQGKLDPVLFARTFCLSLLDEAAVTLLSLALELSVTASALCQRFAQPSCVEYFRRLLQLTLCELDRAANPPKTDIPIFSRFRGVYLADGTTLMLPECLAGRFPGCGGGAGAADTRATAAVKILLRYRLDCPGDVSVLLEGARTPDKNMLASMSRLEAGALLITDLGFFDGERFAEMERQGCFWLTRLPAQLSLQEDGGEWTEPVDLPDRLGRLGVGQHETTATMSRKSPFRGRVMLQRCPEAVAVERRRRALQKCKGVAPGRRKLALCDWWTLATNAPGETMSAKEATNPYRSRWQIELVFERWKSLGRLAIDPKYSQNRAECELYARLMGVLMVDHLAASGGGSLSGKSMWLAWEQALKLVPMILLALRGLVSWEVVRMEWDRLSRARPRQSRRKKRPSTRQTLYQ